MTAVVVGYNSARHLADLGRALASGSVAPEVMLLVDNASTDDTAPRARTAGFDVYETGSNKGFGAACNEGLRLASTELVLICNPDVRPSPTALELLIGALSRHPTAAIAGAACDRPGHARRFSTIGGNVWGFLPAWLQRRLKRLSPEVPIAPGEAHVVDYVVGAFMLCRVAALRSVDGFDERFFLYSEEEDLCRRLGERGWQTLLLPDVEVAHEDRGSSEGVEQTVMASFYLHSVYRYYRKHRSRLYAELARCILSACVTVDRAYRGITRKRQVYGPGTATAPFRSIDSIRRELDRRAGRHPA